MTFSGRARLNESHPKFTSQKSRTRQHLEVGSPPRQRLLTRNIVTVLHLAGASSNLLKGELLTMWLKFGVALSGELTSIDEVGRGKTNLACLYCGGSLTE